MSEVLFDIVFKGRFVNTIEKEKAVENFSKLFKLPIEKAAKFFDGKPRTLKKSLAMEKASQFRKALKNAGIRVSLNKIQDARPQKSELTLSEPGVVIVNKPFIQPKSFDVQHFTLEEVGATIVKYTPIEKKQYDLSNFHVDEVGSVMAETPQIPEPVLDISNITMDEVGAVFAEKENIKAPEFNFSDLSIEEVGAKIVEKETPPAPEINIDDIQLVD